MGADPEVIADLMRLNQRSAGYLERLEPQDGSTTPVSDYTPQPVMTIAGTVGKAPSVQQTSKGSLVKFSVAVKTGYPNFQAGETEGPPDDWYDVAVWNEALQANVMKEIYRGAKVAVEGRYSEREYDGRMYKQLSGSRIGIVDYLTKGAFTPTAAPAAAPAPTPVAERDLDDLPF